MYGCGGGEDMAASVSCEGWEPLGGYESPWLVSVLRGSCVDVEPTHDSEEAVVPFAGRRNIREYLDVMYQAS